MDNNLNSDLIEIQKYLNGGRVGGTEILEYFADRVKEALSGTNLANNLLDIKTNHLNEKPPVGLYKGKVRLDLIAYRVPRPSSIKMGCIGKEWEWMVYYKGLLNLLRKTSDGAYNYFSPIIPERAWVDDRNQFQSFIGKCGAVVELVDVKGPSLFSKKVAVTIRVRKSKILDDLFRNLKPTIEDKGWKCTLKWAIPNAALYEQQLSSRLCDVDGGPLYRDFNDETITLGYYTDFGRSYKKHTSLIIDCINILVSIICERDPSKEPRLDDCDRVSLL